MATVKLLDPNDTRRRLDRYELIGEIASGGMATVFLARLAGVGGFQRFVAIKRLHPHLANEQEFVEMFLDEARLAAGIHHQHVVPILEVGMSDSGFYLVMEYIEGDTLARIVARALSNGSAVPQNVLLRVLLDALAGLGAAHQLTDPLGNAVNLVHRDCSPQNVLVGSDGCSRITDFGVARASSRLSNTRADKLKGKIAYMSPEQARGVDIDRRADLFAMGVILWEVLAGRRLFKAETEAGTLSRVLIEPIPRLSSVLPQVHPALDEVVMKALERHAEDRYQSAAEMADALERAAREAAQPNEVGVASPREVAAYVQRVLGTDIAAQRESVRAWLSQSESGAPRVKAAAATAAQPKAGPTLVSRSDVPPPPSPRVNVEVVSNGESKPRFDVTIKIPLDRPSPAPAVPDLGLPPPKGLLPLLPPMNPRAPVSAVMAPPSPKPEVRETKPPSSGGTIVGIGPEGAALIAAAPVSEPTNPGLSPDAEAAVRQANAELNDLLHEVENDHDTLLMVRGHGQPAFASASNTNLSSAVSLPVSLIDPPASQAPLSDDVVLPVRRAPKIAAVLFGLVVVIGAFVIWMNFFADRGGPAPAAVPSDQPTTEASSPPQQPPPQAPASTAAPQPPPPESTAPPAATTSEPAGKHGGGGHSRGSGGGRTPKSPATTEPTSPPPAPTNDELTNPYR